MMLEQEIDTNRMQSVDSKSECMRMYVNDGVQMFH